MKNFKIVIKRLILTWIYNWPNVYKSPEFISARNAYIKTASKQIYQDYVET